MGNMGNIDENVAISAQKPEKLVPPTKNTMGNQGEHLNDLIAEQNRKSREFKLDERYYNKDNTQYWAPGELEQDSFFSKVQKGEYE